MVGSLYQRARFMAGLLWRIASRALPRRKISPALAPKDDHPDEEAVYEALMSGDVAALDRFGPALAISNAQPGVPFLLEAVSFGNLACVEWFLRHGANPNAADGSGATAIEMVVKRNLFADPAMDDLWVEDCEAILHALIRFGGTVNAPGSLGLTPLHHMVVMASGRHIGWLLRAGADPQQRDASPVAMTALEHAEKLGKKPIIEMLRNAGTGPV